MTNSRQKGKRAEEVWRPVVGYEGYYEVSNLGRVKSLPRATTRGRILKPYVNKRNGCVYYALSMNGKQRTVRGHKIVLEAFTDYRVGSLDGVCIDHRDGDKTNNNLENLEPVTFSENMKRAKENDLLHFKGNACIDLDSKQVYKTFCEAARACGGKQGEMIRRVCDGERSHYRNRHFARLEDYLHGTIPEFSGRYQRKASEQLWR